MENFKQDVDIKLIALDMDGTLLNNKGQISEGTGRRLKKHRNKVYSSF